MVLTNILTNIFGIVKYLNVNIQAYVCHHINYVGY